MTTLRDATSKRFSLRSLLLVVTACCLLLGLWSVYADHFRQQARSIAAVKRLQGGIVTVPAYGPFWQRWIVTTMLGRDAFVNVWSVNLAGKEVDDQTMRSLDGLTQLCKLNLDRTQITDEGAAALVPMKQLDSLSLKYTHVSDHCAEILATLPQLKTLHLTGTDVSDAAIDDLAKLQALQEIYIRWTRITDAGAERLREGLPHCEVYHYSL